jgi:hypothetical protein
MAFGRCSFRHAQRRSAIQNLQLVTEAILGKRLRGFRLQAEGMNAEEAS